MYQELLLGSNNSHKIKELQAILSSISGQEITILLPNAVPNFPNDIPETGQTLEENAFIKAYSIWEKTGKTALSDDTGLEIDALKGEPGVKTARFAGENASSSENRAKVLQLLKNIPELSRTARFRTIICLHNDIRTIFAEGICEGRISIEERGSDGFGYDSIFIPEGYSLTFAEMDNDEKNTISHRAKALKNLKQLLEKYRD